MGKAPFLSLPLLIALRLAKVNLNLSTQLKTFVTVHCILNTILIVRCIIEIWSIYRTVTFIALTALNLILFIVILPLSKDILKLSTNNRLKINNHFPTPTFQP